MNDVVRKWNEYQILKDGEKLNTSQYMINNNIKIIDLKNLTQVGYHNPAGDISKIIKEYAEELLKNHNNTCPYHIGNLNDTKCRGYYVCFLCELDYLSSINRIKIIEGNES